MRLICTLPIKTVSEANCSEHWTSKRKRHIQQQFFVKHVFKAWENKITLPCQVTLIRLGSRFLDEKDNLPMSFKWIADQVADCLIPGLAKGRADDDPRISWQYKQEKSKKNGIKIEVFTENEE